MKDAVHGRPVREVSVRLGIAPDFVGPRCTCAVEVIDRTCSACAEAGFTTNSDAADAASGDYPYLYRVLRGMV